MPAISPQARWYSSRTRAGSRSSKTACRIASTAALFCLVGAHDAALRMRCTMQRCHAAPGKTSSIARLSPSWASDVTQRTPEAPRSRRERRNASHPA